MEICGRIARGTKEKISLAMIARLDDLLLASEDQRFVRDVEIVSDV